MTSTIEFRQLIQTQLRGGVLLDCTRSERLDNELVSRYLVEQLRMKPVVALDCDDFPSVSLIVDGRTNFPIQIFASMNAKLCMLTSDIVIPATHEKQLARGLIAWAKKQSLALIVTMNASEKEKEGEISAAFSTESSKQRIIQSKTDLMEKGSFCGLASALLNEGAWSSLDVIALKIRTDSISPEEIAEKTLQAIDVVIPEVKFDMTSMLDLQKPELGLSGSSTSFEK
ncbi:MAG: PAC2 family protein [Nitrososphaerales archaeon]